MSYKNREVQPELFCIANRKHKKNIFKKDLFWDSYKSAISISCDTLIVCIIGFLMIVLTSFVLGIEKGKVIAKTAPVKKYDKTVQDKQNRAAGDIKTKKVSSKKQINDTLEKNNATEKELDFEKTNSGYIIQLVTYTNNDYANKELEKLKAKGHCGSVLRSGKYFVVYSGMYDTKSTAIKDLNNFKRRYKDCFVRFLKNS